MKNKFKRSALAVVLILVLLMANACGAQKQDQTQDSDNGAQKEIYIAMIAKGYQHVYWKTCQAGAEAAAKELGVKLTFEAPQKESEYAIQADQVSAALGKNPDALLLAPLDEMTLLPYVEQAKEKGIPVVLFDSGMESTDIPVSFIATDHAAAGAAAADKFAEACGGKGKVAIIANSESSSTHIARRDGFINRLKEKYPDIEVVAVEYSDGGDNLKAADAAKAIASAHPDLTGFYSTGEGNSNGIIAAINEMQAEGKYIAVGFDCGQLQKQAVRDGLLIGAIAQNPYEIGRKAVETAYKAINGETVDKFTDSGFIWYNKDNVDDPSLKDILYD